MESRKFVFTLECSLTLFFFFFFIFIGNDIIVEVILYDLPLFGVKGALTSLLSLDQRLANLGCQDVDDLF